MALITTISGLSSDSYGTLAEADLYFTGHVDSNMWSMLDIAHKEYLLKTAAQLMEKWDYQGEPVVAEQALAWPRVNVYRGFRKVPVPSDVIPQEIKDAQFELALFVYDNYNVTNYASIGISGMAISGAGAYSALPELVRSKIQPFLKSRSFSAVRIQRGFDSDTGTSVATSTAASYVSKFVSLSDVPNSYEGYADAYVKVNSTGDGLLFSAFAPGSSEWGSIAGTITAQTDLMAVLNAKSDNTHTHDDRYYTETETDALLSQKSDNTHVHDDRYYTEGEITTLLAEKAGTLHTHDDRYYTETEVDSALAGKASITHTHTDKENALGNPSTDGYVLSSTAAGVRSWILNGSGGGISTFLGLTDTPDTYTGQAGKIPVVNQAETGLEYTSVPSPTEVAATAVTQDSTHRFVTDAEKTTWNGKANASHTHDDRYYTETEVNSALAGKEAALGNPATSGYVLSSSNTGTRTWIAPPTSVTVGVAVGNVQAVAAPVSNVSVGSGSHTISLTAGDWHKVTATGSFTVAFSFPSGTSNGVVVECVNWGAYTITFPASIMWANNTQPTFTASGKDILVVVQGNDNIIYGSIFQGNAS